MCIRDRLDTDIWQRMRLFCLFSVVLCYTSIDYIASITQEYITVCYQENEWLVRINNCSVVT